MPINLHRQDRSLQRTLTNSLGEFYLSAFTGGFVNGVHNDQVLKALLTVHGYLRVLSIKNDGCHFIHLCCLVCDVRVIQFALVCLPFDRPVPCGGMKFGESFLSIQEKPVKVVHAVSRQARRDSA